MQDEDVWFEPKRFGYGAGWPVAWQGWALLAGYVAVVAVAGLLLPDHRFAFLMVTIAATVALLPLVAMHTRGGWRWRMGGEDE